MPFISLQCSGSTDVVESRPVAVYVLVLPGLLEAFRGSLWREIPAYSEGGGYSYLRAGLHSGPRACVGLHPGGYDHRGSVLTEKEEERRSRSP